VCLYVSADRFDHIAIASRRALIELATKRREEWIRRGGLIMPGAEFDDGLANKVCSCFFLCQAIRFYSTLFFNTKGADLFGSKQTVAETSLDDALGSGLVHAAQFGHKTMVAVMIGMLKARGRVAEFVLPLGAALETAARSDFDEVISVILSDAGFVLSEDQVKARFFCLFAFLLVGQQHTFF